jgi:hypothetical protein
MSGFNRLNPLKQWVITNKYFIKTTDPKEKKINPTHYLLDGGIWKIPIDKYHEFLKLLAIDLQNEERHYISENRTDVFKFICDLDFYENQVISIKQIEIIVNTIQSVIEEYYGTSRVIICGSDSKNVVIDSVEYVKSGFHLVWPDIWITKENAKEIRFRFIERLLNEYGERDPVNSWEDVVDLAVYEDNGLRMIGCRKMGICKSCKNKKEFRETCLTCAGNGKIDENRVYKPKSVLNSDINYLSQLTNDYLFMVSETSIYNYQSIPETVLLTELSITKVLKKKKAPIPKTDEETTKIEKFIKRNFKEHYSKFQIKKLTKVENCYFAETEDNFCMNVNRNHTSSGVYFQIRSSGICQRCYCKKTTTDGRLFGACSNYSSKEVPLSKPLQTFLFGIIANVVKGKVKQIVNMNITRSINLSNKEMCLNNCKTILWKLENDLKK